MKFIDLNHKLNFVEILNAIRQQDNQYFLYQLTNTNGFKIVDAGEFGIHVVPNDVPTQFGSINLQLNTENEVNPQFEIWYSDGRKFPMPVTSIIDIDFSVIDTNDNKLFTLILLKELSAMLNKFASLGKDSFLSGFQFFGLAVGDVYKSKYGVAITDTEDGEITTDDLAQVSLNTIGVQIAGFDAMVLFDRLAYLPVLIEFLNYFEENKGNSLDVNFLHIEQLRVALVQSGFIVKEQGVFRWRTNPFANISLLREISIEVYKVAMLDSQRGFVINPGD